MDKLTQGAIMRILDWAYDKAINGIPGMESAEELARSYMKKEGTLPEKVDSFIKWQNMKSAASGFITGFGGIATLPVTIPANITSVLFIQIRMVAAIAYMGGYDIRDDKVRTLVYTCLLGNAAKDVMKEIGIQIGKRATEQAIKKISGELIAKINERVGFNLLSKFGGEGIIKLGKVVPVAGGIIGLVSDGVANNIIGKVAKNTFIDGKK